MGKLIDSDLLKAVSGVLVPIYGNNVYKAVLTMIDTVEPAAASELTVDKLLNITYADDTYIVNIHGNGQKYIGYSDAVPEDLKNQEIENVYLDWASEAIGITLREHSV